MNVDAKEVKQEVEKKRQDARRGFLKKAVYAAPTIVVMGALLKPKEANAFGGPPSDPNDQNGPWG